MALRADPTGAYHEGILVQAPALPGRRGMSPTLRREVETELAALYVDARGLADGALRDHGEPAAADALPETCPYSLDQIISDWLPKQ